MRLFNIFISVTVSAALTVLPLDVFDDIFSGDFITVFISSNHSDIPLAPERLPTIGGLFLNDIDAEMFLSLDYIANYKSLVISPVESVDEAMDVLAKLSSSISRETNVTKRKYMKRIQILFIIQNHLETVQEESEMKERIERKVDFNALAHFDLSSSVLLAFYGTKVQFDNENYTAGHDSFDIWEMYSIKNVSVVNLMAKAVGEKYLQSFLQLESRRVSKRQNWLGIDIVAAPFLVADVVDNGGEFTEIRGVTKYEVNLKKSSTTGELRLYPSLSAKIFWDFEMALNFTGKVIRPFAYSSGFGRVINENGHVFDITISHFTLVPHKFKYAQHLEPTYYNEISAFFVQPPVHAFRSIYATPFKLEMWKMIAVTWAIIGISFHVIKWVRRLTISNDCFENQAVEIERDEQVASDCFWWAIAAFCQQGWYMTPSTTPSRITFAIGLLFSLLCYSAYTATIVSELWDSVVPIRSLEALIDNSRDIFVSLDSDIADIVVENLLERNPEYLSKVRQRNTTPALLHHLVHAGQGKSCFLNWPEYFIDYAKQVLVLAENAQYYNQHTSSNVEVEVCEKFSSYPYKYVPVKAAMFVHKDSPFFRLFNFRILISRERGLLRRYWVEYLRFTSVRCLAKINKTYALGLYDTWAVFASLLAGYAISLCILPMEIIVRHGQRMLLFASLRK